MTQKKLPWLDLSSYELKMSVVKLQNGARLLVMSDGEHASKAAEALGFHYNDKGRFWVMRGSRFNPRAFLTKLHESGFTDVKPVMLEASKVLIDLSAKKPVKENPPAPPQDTTSEKQEPAEAKPSQKNWLQQAAEAKERELDLLKSAHRLGLNRLGQEVYQGPDGRFLQESNGRLMHEKEVGTNSPFLFLRAVDDASLAFCADGVALELAGGKILRLSDFKRFLNAIYGRDVALDGHSARQAFVAVETALSRALAKQNKSGRDLFNNAQRLHEAQAFFSSVASDHAAAGYSPLATPISVAMQRLIGTEKDVTDKSIHVVNPGSGSLFMHLPKGGNVQVFESRSNLLPGLKLAARAAKARVQEEAPDWQADVHLVNLSGRSNEIADELFESDGLKLSRNDLATLVDGLGKRSDDGRSVVSLTPGSTPEEQEELKACIEWLARHYAIEGIADIDEALALGNPDADALRILVIGQRRPEPLPEAPEAALRLRNVEDFPSLWTWTSEVASNRAKIANYHSAQAEPGDAAEEREEDREVNTFQTPYVSASRLGSPSTMIPRNLEGATRKALRRIVKKHGDIDGWVSSELAMSKEQLAEVFSPEQVDAIALQMEAGDSGRGFLLGDQTGIGKGRSLTGMMLRAVHQGKKVIFMTERPSNLSDIWRDIMHAGAGREFSPLILNSNTKIIDEVTGDTVLRSRSKRDMEQLFETGAWPEGSNLLLTSYGQLSRTPEQSEKVSWLLDAVDENTFVVLDEAHNAASRTSKTAVNVEALLAKCGGVVYSSGTPAKTSKNMSFFNKLFPDDMDADEIADIMRRGGETMQEVVATMLVSDGVMLRREHDLSTCEFIQVLDDANEERNCQYTDQMAEVLSEMFYLSGEIARRASVINEAVEGAIEEAENQGQRNRLKSMMVNSIHFGSPLAHLSRLFVSALKVDKAVEVGLEELRTGGKPIFLVDNTLESLLREIYTNQEEDDAVLPDFKHVMHRALTQLTRTRQQDGEEVDLLNQDRHLDWVGSLTEAAVGALPRDFLEADDEIDVYDVDFRSMMLDRVEETIENAKANRHMDDDELLSLGQARREVINQIEALPEDAREAAPAIRDILAGLPETPNRLIERIRVMIDRLPDLPASVIDEIRERLENEGYRVGEITGRGFECREGRIVRRARPDKVVVKNDFNRGELDAAIINNSGATGVDMHASGRFPDQRRRAMIEVQAPMDVAKQIQAYGRVQRFDQVVSPRIFTLLTGLPVEQRFAAMRNQKLRRLSANITANRDNAVLLEDIPDIMNAVGDKVCTHYGDARPDLMRRLGLNMNEDAEPRHDENANEDQVDNKRSANTFLARLIMLPVEMQVQISNELIAEFVATVEDLDAKGMNSLRPRELKGTVYEDRTMVFDGIPSEDPHISAFHQPVYAVEAREEYPVTPARSDELARAMESGMMKLAAEGPEVYAERLRLSRNRFLEPYLPLTFRTVEDAIDAGVGNMITAATRLDRLVDTLSDLRIGSEVFYTDFDGERSSGIVTNITMPSRGYEHLAAQYRLELLQPGDFIPVSFRLQSLMRDENFSIEEGVNGDKYDDIVDLFDNAEGGMRVRERTILAGNLFRAMSLNVQHDNKLGSINVYTSAEHGRTRGLVMSSSFGKLALLPVQLSNHTLASRALMEHRSAVYCNPENRTKSPVSISPKRYDDGFLLKLPSRRNAKFGHLRRQADVIALTEDLPSNRRRGGTIEVELNGPEQIQRATSLLYRHGVRFYASGNLRNAVNEWRAAGYHGDPDQQPEADEQNEPNVRAA